MRIMTSEPLMRLLAPAILMGPLLLLAVSTMIASLEERADRL
jgi:sodium transport system permease protein